MIASIVLVLVTALPARDEIPMTIEWSRGFGSGTEANRARQLPDGSFILVGTSPTPDGDDDLFLAKLDRAGEIAWSRTYGDPTGGDGRSVWATSDGGFAAVGMTYGSYAGYLVKTDGGGNSLWDKILAGGWQRANDVTETDDGSILVLGEAPSVPPGEIRLLKTGLDGTVLWEKPFSIPGGVYGNALAPADDGTFFVTGPTYANGGIQVLVVRFDRDGEPLWHRILGSEAQSRAIVATRDGGAAIAGDFRESPLFKVDGRGEKTWLKSCPDGYGMAIAEVLGGGYVVTGGGREIGSGLYVLRTDSAGDPIWRGFDRKMGGARSIGQTIDGGFLVAGTGRGGTQEAYLVKYAAPGGWQLFHRGDANADGRLDVTDGINCLLYLFAAGRVPACLDAADANDDGKVDSSDPVFLLRFLFLGEAPPPWPGPPPRLCGSDPDPEGSPGRLGCAWYDRC